MFAHVHIQNLRQYPDRQVTLKGWVRGKEKAGDSWVIELRDGTGTVKCVCTPGVISPEGLTLAGNLTPESSVTVTGQTASDGGKSYHGMEVRVTALGLVGPAAPLVPGGGPVERKHLWFRSPEGQATLRVRNAAQKAVRDYFDWSGFTLVDAPVLVPPRRWGKGNAPKVEKPDAELSRSAELFVNVAAFAVGKAYSFGPVFGHPKDPQPESWSIETAVAFAELDDAMTLAEDFLSYLVHRLAAEQADDLRTLKRNPVPLNFVKKPFPRLEGEEAEKTIRARAHDRPVLSAAVPARDELWSVRRDSAKAGSLRAFEIVAPEGYGVIGSGSERETDPVTVEKRLKAAGLKSEPFTDWLETLRYGAAPVAGFSVNLERFLCWLTASG